jgi:hypothetical protein
MRSSIVARLTRLENIRNPSREAWDIIDAWSDESVKLVTDYLFTLEDDYSAAQSMLLRNPQLGPLVSVVSKAFGERYF